MFTEKTNMYSKHVPLSHTDTHLVQGVRQQSVVAAVSEGLQGGQQLWAGARRSVSGDASWKQTWWN